MGIRNAARLMGLAGVAAAGIAAGLAAGKGRRAARDAALSLHGDWRGRLKAEHKLARGLLKAMAESDFAEGPRRAQLVEKLSELLERHALEEETVIYPAIIAHGGKADGLFKDHAEVKVQVRSLQETAPEDPDWERQAKALRRRLTAHMRIEDGSMFPALHDRLGDDGNAKLTTQMSHQGAKL